MRRRPGIRRAAATGVRPYWRTVVCLVVALLFAAVALGQVQALLAAMHLSGKTPYSIGGLNHLIHAGPDALNTQSAIDTWHAYFVETAKHVQPSAASSAATPEDVVWWAWAVDSIFFAPLYVAAFWTFLSRVRRELQLRGEGAGLTQSDSSALTDSARFAFWMVVAAIAGGVADELENVANLLLVEQNWEHTQYTSGTFHVLIWTLWLAGWFKWVVVLGALAASLVLGWVLLAWDSQAAADSIRLVRGRVWQLRLHVTLALLVVVIFFAHEQMPDLVLRWTPVQLGVDVALAAFLAVTLWLFGHHLLTAGPLAPNWSPSTERWVARGLVCLAVLLAAIQLLVHLTVRGGFRVGWGLAIPAAVILVIAVLSLLTPRSVADLRRGRTDGDEPRPGGPGGGATRGAASDENPALPRFLAATVVIGVAAGILHAAFGSAVYQAAFTWWAPALLAVALGGFVVRLVVGRGEWLLWSGLPVIVVFVGLGLSNDGELNAATLVAVAVLLFAAGLRVFYIFTLRGPARGRVWRSFLVFLGVAVTVCYVVAVANPEWTGTQFSAIGVLFFFFVIAAAAGGLVNWLNPAVPVPRALRVLRLRTYPTVALLVIWFIVAGVIDKGGFHNVRVIPDAPAAAEPVTLGEAFNCWLGKNGLAPSTATLLPERSDQTRCRTRSDHAAASSGATPLILVATTGGGIRAAYWTDLVLSCAFESSASPRRCDGSDADRTTFAASNRIFAASGISGGSLGLASYAAYLKLKERRHASQPNWVRDHLANDALSASGAWWLLVELPRAFLQFRGLDDRAAVLERGWESQWSGHELSGGLFDLWRNHPHAPLLLLNGTSVADGCRFETSVLNGSVRPAVGNAGPPGCRSSEAFDNRRPGDANPTEPLPLDQTPIAPTSVLPGTRSLSDYLCRQSVDVRLSTAALLSARFPFVNPSARVVWRCPPSGTPAPVAYVVDGGYLDTSGASPIEEMMSRLGPMIDDWNRHHQATRTRGRTPGRAARCIVPLLIQIDNGFPAGSSSPSRRPDELLVPALTLTATRGAREAESRIGAGLEFTQPVPYATTVNRYARFVNQAHPGPHAPLGWTQSNASADELTAQLSQDANVNALELVREWLTPGLLKCAPAVNG